MPNKDERSSKTIGKSSKKIKKSSKFVEEPTSEMEYHILGIFKVVLGNFIGFSLYPTKEFIIFAVT
jgi:hypothetical protein